MGLFGFGKKDTVNSAPPNSNNNNAKLRENLMTFINIFNKRNNNSRAKKLNINNKLSANLKTWIGKKRPYQVAAAAAAGALNGGGTQTEANNLASNAGKAANQSASPQVVGLQVNRTPGVSNSAAAAAAAAAAAEVAKQNGSNQKNAAMIAAVSAAVNNASKNTSPTFVGNQAAKAAEAAGMSPSGQKNAQNLAKVVQATRNSSPSAKLQVDNMLRRAGNNSTNKAGLLQNIQVLLNSRTLSINNMARLSNAKKRLEKTSFVNRAKKAALRVFSRGTQPNPKKPDNKTKRGNALLQLAATHSPGK
jgi:hypothetical protein